MSQFQEAFPERTAAAPTLPGQPTITGTVLTQMRRQQLHDLAKAFRVQVPADGTKDQILPSLVAAEQQGVFRQQPIDPYYFHKAQRDADRLEPMPPGLEPLDARPGQPAATTSPPAVVEVTGPVQAPVPSIGELRAACKARGINSFGKGKAALMEALDASGQG